MTENERLKFLRDYYKISQKDMAERLGVKQSAYSAIENGVYNVTSKQIKIIINDFNVNSEWLLNGEGEMLKAEGPKEEVKSNELAAQLKSFKFFLVGNGVWKDDFAKVMEEIFLVKFKVHL